jgi:hypothetical protein
MVIKSYENAIALAEEIEADAKVGRFNRMEIEALAKITKSLCRDASRSAKQSQ